MRWADSIRMCVLLSVLSGCTSPQPTSLSVAEAQAFLLRVHERYATMESYADTGTIVLNESLLGAHLATGGWFRTAVRDRTDALVEVNYERFSPRRGIDESGFVGAKIVNRQFEHWPPQVRHDGIISEFSYEDPFHYVKITNIVRHIFHGVEFTKPAQAATLSDRAEGRFPFVDGMHIGNSQIDGISCLGFVERLPHESELTVYWIGRDDYLVRRIEHAWGDDAGALARDLHRGSLIDLPRPRMPVAVTRPSGHEVVTFFPRANPALTDKDFRFKQPETRGQ